jgi:hypothetical protein
MSTAGKAKARRARRRAIAHAADAQGPHWHQCGKEAA